jgi:hypothetical protein
MSIIQPSPYFEILRALHRGGLSLWLNRRALLPMTLIPTIVTFLTLMLMRANMGDTTENVSSFMLALLQIPADFITGIFCSLVIFIIMKAPKKNDKDAPVMFAVNIFERKDLIIAGAVAHVIFGYFASGIFGIMQMIYNPIQDAAAQQEPASLPTVIMMFGLLAVVFYGIRFILLPLLIIAQIDIREFYKKFPKFGFSLPIFAVKLATGSTAGVIIFFIGSLILSASGGTTENASLTQLGLVDFVTSFATVLSTAWAYAALAIGLRQLLENNT